MFFLSFSGHLYERLLKIMMLSTIRHTNAPVKFWILKHYLSPSLRDFLPAFAKEYGFQYEYVQYKWPRWLNQQKEKQVSARNLTVPPKHHNTILRNELLSYRGIVNADH